MRRLSCLFFVILTVLHACFRCSTAEEECMKSKYMCYECDSWTDPKCKDPFNSTSQDGLGKTECHGCCVKIVMYAATPEEVVRRTCTKRLQINLFMVDHVCMYEGGNTGHMCFCEKDYCNGVQTQHSVSIWVPLICAFLGTTLLNVQHWKNIIL